MFWSYGTQRGKRPDIKWHIVVDNTESVDVYWDKPEED